MHYLRVPIGHWGSRNHHGCHALLLVVRIVDHRWHRCVPKIDGSLADPARLMPMRPRFSLRTLFVLVTIFGLVAV